MSNIVDFTVPPVVKTIELPVSSADAFEHYVRGLPQWFPLTKFFAGTAPPKDCCVEARLGGRLFERTKDGREIVWGRVTVWEPPHRFAYTWQVGTTEDKAQLIELTFVETAGGSRMILHHSGWEKLGEHAARAREGYEGGWEFVLGQCYRKYVLSKAKNAGTART
jgi:uncharacterized protein YndB with AHSA1/START domain